MKYLNLVIDGVVRGAAQCLAYLTVIWVLNRLYPELWHRVWIGVFAAVNS